MVYNPVTNEEAQEGCLGPVQEGVTLSTQVERCYHGIRQRIVGGVYHPSERLVERDLAESLGVGRVSVRSALQRLHQEGLVILEPHRGAKVTALTAEEAAHVLEVREGLEGWAAALAAQRISDDQLAELDRLVTEMKSVVQAGKLLEYSEINDAIHQIVIAAAANPRLKQLIDGLKVSVVRLQFRTILMPGRPEASWREHADMVSALHEHCPGKAEDAMRRHIGTIRQTIQVSWRLMQGDL